MNTEHEKTQSILKWFEEISKIPRCSKKEKAICDWLANWAKERGFAFRRDKMDNLVIDVPASPGYEKAPTTIIQGHMDMVCEKTKDSTHDFDKDPIRLVYEDGWLTADRTTLGSDNGIAIAMALTLATSDDTPHPPLELLFTVDEETGLTGASALEAGVLKGKLLLNVDSEDEGVFTVGCAGGRDTRVTIPIDPVAVPSGYQAVQVTAGGMRGGHSGVDIHQQRANSLKVLTRALHALKQKTDVRLSSVNGGSAHNAIPRDAEAVIYLPATDLDLANQLMAKLSAALKKEYANNDPNVDLGIESIGGTESRALSPEQTRKVLDFVLIFPHGVDAMSTDIDGLVETSNNLATIKTGAGFIETLSSQRSSNMDRLDLLTNRIEALGRVVAGKVETGGGYPAWKPNMDSELLARSKEVYRELFGKEPVVEIIHAGLECGIIGSKFPGMDMLSFGPTIKNPHSPDEKIEIESISKVWDFMAALLKSLK